MGKYHVVCHECPEEGMVEDEVTADRVRETHETETGHRMSCENLDGPAVDA